MPLKNSNTVAAERRMDLASLFCMISRHGPAVALAVIAMVSVLAGFIIYRTVRGKRRKATAAADGGDGESPGAEWDASVIQESPEEAHSTAESTDLSDEGSSDVKEDVDLIQTDLKIRHRRAAAAVEKKPPSHSPPKRGTQAPENKHTSSDDTEEVAVVWDSYKVGETYVEEANQGPPSDSFAVTGMVVEDAADCHHGATDDIVEDVMEEVQDYDGCLKEPELISPESRDEEEKVLSAERQEDEDVITEKDVSVEENFQCALNNPVYFEQTPYMVEKGEDDGLQDGQTTLESNSLASNLVEPVIHIEDVPTPCICYDKAEEFEGENPGGIDYSSFSGNACLSPVEEKKNEGEGADEECVDYQEITQKAEICSSTSEQDTNQPSTQQDQCDDVPPIRDSNSDEDWGLASEVIEEVADEDHLNHLQAVRYDVDEQEVEIKEKEEGGLTCNQEDGVLYDGADQVKVKMLTSDNIVAYRDECDHSSAPLPCLSELVKDEDPSGIVTDAKAQISGIAAFPGLPLDCQQPKKEDEIASSLEESTHCTILGPHMPSDEMEIQHGNNSNGTTMVLAEECNDQDNDTHIQSCDKDQQSVQMINIGVFDKASFAADPVEHTSAVENISAPVIVEEISCPHSPSICHNQQNGNMEIDETLDGTRVDPCTEAAACSNASLTAFLSSDEGSCHDILPSSHDKQSDQVKDNEDFSEVTTIAAPVMTEDVSPLMCQTHSLSFEQSELRDTDLSSPSVGKESGISSMAVSPDLQNAGNEFVLSVMDCDLLSEGRTEAQNSLFADDVAVSAINEDTADVAIGPFSSHCSQPPHTEHTDWATYESFVANEDIFGHKIEESYHRAMDQFMAQIEASVTSFTHELTIQTDMKACVEVVKIKEKKIEVSVEKKEGTKAEKEQEEDYEKTEISIMEATMDNNEWITESNYQVPPWLNLSATSFAQDHTKTNQPPPEECQYSSAPTDTTCMDTTNISPSTDVKEYSSLSLTEESTENNKKVVAVQPMLQNVNVTFRVHYFTQSPYQTVAVTGNQQELGNWKGFIPLEKAKDGHWATVVSLPAESHVEWKFVVLDKGEVCRWEECGNRLLDTGYGDDLLVQKWWGLL